MEECSLTGRLESNQNNELEEQRDSSRCGWELQWHFCAEIKLAAGDAKFGVRRRFVYVKCSCCRFVALRRRFLLVATGERQCHLNLTKGRLSDGWSSVVSHVFHRTPRGWLAQWLPSAANQ